MSSLPSGLHRLQSALSRSDTLRRFVSLASWSLVSFALEKGAMIVVIFMLARILGAEDYGRFTLTQGLVNTLQIFVLLGVGTMLARYIPKMREEGIHRAVEIVNLCALVVLISGAILVIAGLFGAPMVAAGILDLPPSSPIPYLMLTWVAASAVANLFLAVMLSFEQGRILGLISFIGAGLSITVIPMLTNTYGIGGAVAGMVAIELIKTGALVAIYARFIRQSGARVLSPIRSSDAPLLLGFGAPVFLISALWGPTMWLGQMIIKTMAPDGLAAAGVFGLTNNILGAVIIVSSLTNRAALPILSSLEAKGDYHGLRRMTHRTALAQLGAAAIISLPLALGAPLIMAQAGPAFQSAWPILLIMIATGIVLAGQTALANYLLVQGRAYFLLATMAIWTVIVLSTTAWLGEQGAYALAWALLIGAIVRTALILAATNNTRREV